MTQNYFFYTNINSYNVKLGAASNLVLTFDRAGCQMWQERQVHLHNYLHDKCSKSHL